MSRNADRRGALAIFFPAQTLPLWQVFAPCCTAPSFTYFPSSVWALMVVAGRPCLPRRARCACFPQRDLSSWERCLAVARWSLTAGTERLGTLGVTKLGDHLQVHGASWLGTDTTLGAKTAKRMLGGQTWQAHSANADRGSSLVGPHGQLVGLISPWGTRWLGWPMGLRVVPGLQGARHGRVGAAGAPMRCWDAASAAILEGPRCLGDASVRVGAEADDAQAPVLQGLRARDSNVVSRLRQDAVGWDAPAPPPPGQRGRRPRSGRTGPVASGLTAETPRRDRRTLDGPLTAGGCVVRDGWRRDGAQKGRVVGLEGATAPCILVRTALRLAARQILASSGARGSLALTIRDLNHHCGLGDSPWTTTRASRRFVPLACRALCVWRLALLEHLAAGGLQGTAARVSLPEAPRSFPRVRRAWRAWATRQIIGANATPGAAMAKIERDQEPLLHMRMCTGNAHGQPWLKPMNFCRTIAIRKHRSSWSICILYRTYANQPSYVIPAKAGIHERFEKTGYPLARV